MNFSSNQIGLTQATVYDISAADLAGANSGQRPDLLAKTQAIFRTPDQKLYSANAARSQLVAASTPVAATTNAAGDVSLTSGDQNITYPASTWAAMPSAAAVPGVVIRCKDIGNSPAGTMLISDGVYWRPVGGQVHIVERSGSPFYPLTQNTGSAGFNFTLPVAGVIPSGFLIPGESQIEVEVWVKKVGGNGTATLNIYLGLNGSNTTDYRIVQGSFAAADGSELALRPLVTVGNATRLSSATFLTAGSVSPQTNSGTDSAGGMFNSAVPTNLTVNIGAANAADTFRLVAYRVTVKQ